MSTTSTSTSTATSGTRLPAARRRQQLLDVALRVFAEQGYHPTSMNDLAEAAGVTKPVLYQHFASKRELYLELLQDVGGRLHDAILGAVTTAAGPREQVEQGFSAYFRFVGGHREAFQVLFGGGTRRDEEFASYTRRIEETIAGFVSAMIEVEGLPDDDRRLLAYGIVGLAEGASRHWLATEAAGTDDDTARRQADALAARVAELAWAGLRGINRR